MRKSFEEAWEAKKTEGYQYGEDALELVRFGFELARGDETGALTPGALVVNDFAIAIAEEAFKAGYKACAIQAKADDDENLERFAHDAWSAYEPSEKIKDLTS